MTAKRISASDLQASIDSRELLNLASRMIRIPSPFNHEERISRFILQTLDRWGLAPRTVEVPGCGPNVIAETGPSGAPSLVFNGHMDTVEVAQGWKHDPFCAEVEKGRLYGLGSLDMKAGLAGLMLAFRTVAEQRLARGMYLKLQAVSGEELNGVGTRTLTEGGHFKRARGVVVGEGFGGLKVVTNGRRGGYYYDIHVHGKAAHGALPEMGISAVVDASRIVCAVDRMKMASAPRLVSEDQRPLRETQIVQRMSGGTYSLSVPDYCMVRVVRSVVPRRRNDPGREIARVIDKLRLRSHVRVELDERPGEIYEPYLTPVHCDLVKVAKDAIREVTGSIPKLVCGVSEADDNIISECTGVPVICVGPGEIGELAKYHQAEESVEVAQLKPACETYCRIAMGMAR